MPSLLCGQGFDYIECLFVSGDVDGRRPSAIHTSDVRSVAATLQHIEQRLVAGLSRFLLVGLCDSPALDQPLRDGFCISELLRQARRRWGAELTLIADVGLSPYQASGHSVVLNDGVIDEGASYAAVGRLAAAFIAAGADAVAPCLSLPSQTLAIRRSLEASGLGHGEVMPYSTKFSSSLYGPYRGAIGSGLGLQRKAYQFDHDDAERALAQMEQDIAQGAAATIVKPGLPYLDVLAAAVRRSTRPVAVYHVSGETMMALEAARAGLINADDYFDEVHAAFHRCGARYVIGYCAEHALRWQQARARGR